MHQCPVCPKSFPSPYKLQRHYVIHTGQKPFVCIICGKTFTQSDHLKTHSQKLHQSRLPADGLQDGVGTQNQQANSDGPSAGINTCASRKYNGMPLTASSLALQPECKREFVAHGNVNPPKYMPRVDDASVIQSRTSYVMDPIPQEQGDSANEDMSACGSHNGYTKLFPSALHLWSHSPMHNKEKPSEMGKESGQTFSTEVYSKGHLQSQELNSGRSKMTFKHECPKCLKTFCSPSKLRRHFLIHTGQKPYTCMICWKGFRQKVHLKSHLNTANKCSLSASTERKFQRVCQSRQTSEQQRSTSLCTPVNSSVELELQCKISVNAVAKPEQSLNTSQSADHGQQHLAQKSLKPFQCISCKRSFRLEVNLKRHCEIHRKQKQLGRPTSNVIKSDSEEIGLSSEPTHADPIESDITVKPETWSDYNDSLPQHSELMTPAEQQKETCHSSHQQQRMNSIHQCQACSKCFPSLSKLQRHILTHTGQRPFGCETCGKRFRQKTHLRVHCRTHLLSRYHKRRSLYINRPPSCTRPAADVPLQEVLQNKDFVSVKPQDQTRSVVIIQDKSDNLLPQRNEVSANRTPNATSVQNPHNVQHKCFRCLKCFPSASKLQRHEMVHTGLKPFQCVLCGKAFRQTAHLKTHERTHCEGKPYKLINQQGRVRKLKAYGQQQPWSRMDRSVNTDRRHSEGDGVSETRHVLSIRKANSLFNSRSNVTCNKKKRHTCQICLKHFVFAHTLARHMLTHSEPHKCTAQHVHEPKCRQGDGVSCYSPGEIINAAVLQDKSSENLCDSETLREQPESHYMRVAHHSFTEGDSCYRSEETRAAWLAEPQMGSQEKNESEKRQRDDGSLAACSHETDHCSQSFPSDLNFEINKLVQNQNMSAPTVPHQYEDHAAPLQTISDGSDELFSYENQIQPNGYWCEPLFVFECGDCSEVFESENDLKQHVCSANVQPKTLKASQKNRCDVCFKDFVSPSKLKRHYVIHTGQRPFRCDVCGKTFTQSAHARTHQLIH